MMSRSAQRARLDAADGSRERAGPRARAGSTATGSDDGLVFAWLRHYSLVLIVVVLLGVGTALAFVTLRAERKEAWTYVVLNSTVIPPAQLGPVAQAVFSSSGVSRSVAAQLEADGVDADGLSFSVRPVPGTNTVIVTAAAPEPKDAVRASVAAASALVDAFDRAGIRSLRILGSGRPAIQPVLSDAATVGLAGSAFLWLGVAVCIARYRARRPVLTLQRAMSLARARERISTGRRVVLWHFRYLRWLRTSSGRRTVRAVMERTAGPIPLVEVPGASPRVEATMADTLRAAMLELARDRSDGVEGRRDVVLVCGASTPEASLSLAALSRRRPLILWFG